MHAGTNERESIVNFDALRRLSSRLTLVAFAAISSVILGSCGGGGATSNNEQNGALTILPSAASLYAGVAYSFQIAGGRPPYLLSSSEPILLPVPQQVTGHSFQVVPNNPGVIDPNLPPGAVPIRSVIITVRDSFGAVISTPSANGITVGQNFLTGYGVTYTSLCGSGEACSGADVLVRMLAVTNSGLYGNRPFQWCVVRGSFQFVTPEVPSNQPESLVNCYNTVSDHTGVVTARFRVPTSAAPQIATLRLTDVGTGAYVDEAFRITAGTISGNLTVLPNDITFTGPRAGVCGTGSADVTVFDGEAPYTATSASPSITVTPTTSGSSPAKFTISATNPTVCVDKVTVLIQDKAGRRATVTVTTAEGSSTPPDLTVVPASANLNLTCGFSTSVTAVGGAGALSAFSNNQAVTAFVTGNTVTITRVLHDPPATTWPTTATVTVTDGTTIQPVAVSGVPAFCP
jgi:hypothetical protein